MVLASVFYPALDCKDCEILLWFYGADIIKFPRRYFRCGFICFMFGAVQFLNVLILTLL